MDKVNEKKPDDYSDYDDTGIDPWEDQSIL